MGDLRHHLKLTCENRTDTTLMKTLLLETYAKNNILETFPPSANTNVTHVTVLCARNLMWSFCKLSLEELSDSIRAYSAANVMEGTSVVYGFHIGTVSD